MEGEEGGGGGGRDSPRKPHWPRRRPRSGAAKAAEEAKATDAANALALDEAARTDKDAESFDAAAAAEAKVAAMMKASADAKQAEKDKLAQTFESRDPTAIWLKERGLRLNEWRESSPLPPPKQILLETGEIEIEQSNVGAVDWLFELVERIGHGSGPKVDEHMDVRR